jgi:serine phosphatase RsbU (regulator of sigma subunit)
MTNDDDNLKNEIMNLRKQAAINSQLGEFVLEIYNMKSVSNVFDALIKRLYMLTFFDRIVFLTLNIDTAELKIEFSRGFGHGDHPHFSFDIFENPDANIISAIFDKKSTVVVNGFCDINDLSLRLDMDNYLMVPMVLHNEEDDGEHLSEETQETSQNENESEREKQSFVEERNKLKNPYFPVSGIFVFSGDKMDETELKTNATILEKIIRLAGMTMNNILVLERLQLTCEKNEKELKQARGVQQKLLPEKLPCNDFLQSFAFYIPVEEVGGDYYDLFMLKDGVYAVFIADVSGHGVSAALVMSAAKILLKTIASADLDPAQTLRKVNDTLVNNISVNRFLTAFYAIIDTNQRKMTYTCAGHCPILLFNKDKKDYQQFQSDGFFVGMFPELDLPNHEFRYTKGENRLILYTDGVVDCQNRKKSQFGLIRLKSIIAKTLDESAEHAVQTVENEMKKFIGNYAIEDDQTIFIVDF